MAQAELDEMLAREYSRGWEMAEPCRKENEKLKTALRACRALIDAILCEQKGGDPISPVEAQGHASYFYAGRSGVKQSGLAGNQRSDLVKSVDERKEL